MSNAHYCQIALHVLRCDKATPDRAHCSDWELWTWRCWGRYARCLASLSEAAVQESLTYNIISFLFFCIHSHIHVASISLLNKCLAALWKDLEVQWGSPWHRIKLHQNRCRRFYPQVKHTSLLCSLKVRRDVIEVSFAHCSPAWECQRHANAPGNKMLELQTFADQQIIFMFKVPEGNFILSHSYAVVCVHRSSDKMETDRKGRHWNVKKRRNENTFFFCKLICCIWGINPNMTNDQGLDAFTCRPKRDAASINPQTTSPLRNQIIKGSCPRAHHGRIFTGYCSN